MIKTLKRLAKDKGDNIAVRDLNKSEDNELTWKEFYNMSINLSAYFIDIGIKENDRVAICINNCLEWLPIWFGVVMSGAIAVPINPLETKKIIGHCVKVSNCDAIIYGSLLSIKIKRLTNNTDIPFEEGLKCDEFKKNCPLIETNCIYTPCNEKVVAINFSSGTAGSAKPVQLMYKSFLHTAYMEKRHHGQNERDVFLCLAPLYHIGAFSHWLGSFLVGSTTVITKMGTPNMLFEIIQRHNVSIVWLLLPWVQDILEAVEVGDVDIQSYDLSSWRLMHMGAQPIPEEVVNKWNKLFPGQQFDINYGLTESGGPGCVHLGIDKEFKCQMLGRPDEEWEVAIKVNNSITKEPNIEGEILVRGPGLMKGYYNDVVSTKEVLSDEGWLHTGDIGLFDENGIVYFTGRKKDIIIVGGENVYPLEIENLIKEVYGVKDVAVIGVPNKRFGEVVGAIIEISRNIDVDLVKKAVKRHCKFLPSYKQPLELFFGIVSRNFTGKINKKELLFKYVMQRGEELND